MPRRRFAVALLIPPPASIEIDALRRALGDRQFGKIDPHITIVPPINLRDDDVAEAMATVDAAAAGCAPCELTLGPVETFGPTSPVRFLRVEPAAPVEVLHAACWTGVFDREEKRPFHPHVTIDIDGGPTDVADPALRLLAGFTTDVRVDEVTLLEHHHDDAGRRWEPFSRYPLRGRAAPPAPAGGSEA